MYPTISAALAQDHHHTLLDEAARSRRAAEAHVETARPTVARRKITRPFAAFQCWLARGYL